MAKLVMTIEKKSIREVLLRFGRYLNDVRYFTGTPEEQVKRLNAFHAQQHLIKNLGEVEIQDSFNPNRIDLIFNYGWVYIDYTNQEIAVVFTGKHHEPWINKEWVEGILNTEMWVPWEVT